MEQDSKPTKKATIRLYAEDIEYLKSAYPGTGYNAVLRSLAARHVRRLRGATQEAMQDKLTAEELRTV